MRHRVVAHQQRPAPLERLREVVGARGRAEHRRVGLVGEHDHEHVLDRRQLRAGLAGLRAPSRLRRRPLSRRADPRARASCPSCRPAPRGGRFRRGRRFRGRFRRGGRRFFGRGRCRGAGRRGREHELQVRAGGRRQRVVHARAGDVAQQHAEADEHEHEQRRRPRAEGSVSAPMRASGPPAGRAIAPGEPPEAPQAGADGSSPRSPGAAGATASGPRTRRCSSSSCGLGAPIRSPQQGSSAARAAAAIRSPRRSRIDRRRLSRPSSPPLAAWPGRPARRRRRPRPPRAPAARP